MEAAQGSPDRDAAQQCGGPGSVWRADACLRGLWDRPEQHSFSDAAPNQRRLKIRYWNVVAEGSARGRPCSRVAVGLHAHQGEKSDATRILRRRTGLTPQDRQFRSDIRDRP